LHLGRAGYCRLAGFYLGRFEDFAMIPTEEIKALMKAAHPMPWVLDACNNREVHITDFRGDIVHFENFEDGSLSKSDIWKAQATAQLLVAISKELAAAQ
jgi:hypothetical protein